MDVAALSPAVQALRRGELRVWSFVVTIFGDMARAPGQELSGAQLSALTEAAGIKPQALRTALHRLRKDGWIDSRRIGRGAFHFLTEHGRAQAEQAAARIYDFDAVAPEEWHLVVMPDRARVLPGHVPVAPGCFLGHGSAPDMTDALVLSGPDLCVPDWVRAQVMPDDLLHDYAEFERALRLVLGEPSPMSDLEATVQRLLAVHGWRRLVLRCPALPDLLYPDAWAGPGCRQLMADLLDRLGPATAPG
ncbi:PaaX family transcriptional regulator C-terminal domain-containing protein [Aliiroseovarius sp.]|uniref:PaaX family transcriptional regulator C-terminal domain-containing protein n=1 Tax=Aliiroseovarius sp. TaxID=1872442 RepID=UPI00263006CE|nr:PaaX family transcriptional regulator C-terminal domain-containing protein [Aliiroseovarius sp.]